MFLLLGCITHLLRDERRVKRSGITSRRLIKSPISQHFQEGINSAGERVPFKQSFRVEGQSHCHHTGRQKSHPQGQGPVSWWSLGKWGQALQAFLWVLFLDHLQWFSFIQFFLQSQVGVKLFLKVKQFTYLDNCLMARKIPSQGDWLRDTACLNPCHKRGDRLFQVPMRPFSLKCRSFKDQVAHPREALQSQVDGNTLTHWSHIPPPSWSPSCTGTKSTLFTHQFLFALLHSPNKIHNQQWSWPAVTPMYQR